MRGCQITAVLHHREHEDNANEKVRSFSPKKSRPKRKQNPSNCKAPETVKGFKSPHLTEVSSNPSEQVSAFPFHRQGNGGSPGVPSRAALAPAKVRRPPSLRCLVARWLEMVDVHMLCFHIRSQFLKRAEQRNT